MAELTAEEYDDDDFVIHYRVWVDGKEVWSIWGYADEDDVQADVAAACLKYGIER